jgi:cell division septation protein DedD
MTVEEDDKRASFDEPDLPEPAAVFEEPPVPAATRPADDSPRFAAASSGKKKPLSLLAVLLLLLLVLGVAGGLFLLAQNLIPPEAEVTPYAAQKNTIIQIPAQPAPLPAEGVTEEVVSSERVATAVDDLPPQAEKPLVAQALETPVRVEAPPEPPVTPAVKAEVKQLFALESAGYLSAGAVKKARARLEQLGYATTRSRHSEKHKMTRLLVDLYPKPQAEARLAEIRVLSEGAFMAAEHGKFAVYAGSFLSAANARKLAERLRRKGVEIREIAVPVDLQSTRLKFGSFSSRDQALKVAAKLKKNGLGDLQVVPVK